MLHILLLILKLIGIVIASLLGLLLLMVLLILFVPIRYQAELKWYDKPDANIKVGWLCRILYLRVLFKDNNLFYRIRVFGFNIKDNTKPEKEKKQRRQRRSKKSKKKKSSSRKTKKSEIPQIPEKTMESGKPVSKSGAGEDSEEKTEIAKEVIDIKDKAVDKVKEEISENITDIHDHIEPQTDKKDDSNKGTESSKEQSKKQLQEDNKSEKKKKTGFVGKIKALWNRIKNMFLKIPKFFQNIRLKIKNLFQLKDNIFNKVSLIKNFISEEQNKAGVKAVFRYIKKMIKHVLPTKTKGYVKFGTGDPCLTGQILGALAMFLPYYKDSLKIVPDFEETMIEGEIFVKGRIRLGTLLIIGVRVLLNKECRQLYRNFRILKEEL